MLTGCTHQRGMALILVLWLLVVLGLVVTSAVAMQRLENRHSQIEIQRSKAIIAAEGGLSMVLHELLKHPERFKANGQPYQAILDDAMLTFSVRSEHGKLDLNFGNLEYFARLFRFMGASPAATDTMISKMGKRRDNGDPLQHFEDLLVAVSMDTVLYQRILPYVTLWGGDAVPVAAFADPLLSKAIGLSKAPQQHGNPGSVLGIDVQATLADGFSAGLMATVLITQEDTEAGIFKVLHWQEH